MLLIIFSFQVAPVKALGKLLAKAQTTEEVHNDGSDNSEDDGSMSKFNDLYLSYHYPDVAAQTLYFKNKISGIIHRADALPATLVADVQSPPPDCK
jgi:hypothetical protein